MTKGSSTEAVKVMVRVRPMNTKEKERDCQSVLRVDKATNQIEIAKQDQSENAK